MAILSQLYKPLTYTSVFFIYYILFLNQGLQYPGLLGSLNTAETYHHIQSSQLFLHEPLITLFKKDFQPLLHVLTASVACVIHFLSKNEEMVDFANAMALILSSAKLAQFIIVKKILDKSIKMRESESLFATIIINFCTVLYLPFITLNIFVPMGTPNMLVDPTNIVLTPIAIIFFYLYIQKYINKNHFHNKSLNYKYTLFLMFTLITATLIKPAFTNVILVIIGGYYAFKPRRFTLEYLWHDLLIYTPSCLILLTQMYMMSKSDAAGTVIFAPYKVINFRTNHPIIALFQAIEFPLLITVLHFFKKMQNTYFYFAWLFTIISYLIGALFCFSGPQWDAGNLLWSYQIGLTLLYVFSIIEYIKLTSANTIDSAPYCLNKSLINISTFNLCFIFLSGINQFIKVFLGGSYF